MTDISVIDVEASGLHFDSYPIEIAVLRNGQSRSWLIKPEPNWNYWCDTAESLHGISRNMLDKEGLPASKVVDLLNEFLLNFDGILYSDAYRWDTDWVDTLYYSVKRPCPFHIGSIYDLLPENIWHQFDQLKAELAASGRFQHHRASDDVRMIAAAFDAVSSM